MRAVKSLLSEHPVLSGQFSKSRIEPLVNRINKSSIKRTPLLSGHGHLIIIPFVPLKGGWVVSTPLSTVFCHQLYSDPPLCHHLEHNPPIAFSVALSSLFPSPCPCIPWTIWQTRPLLFFSFLFTCPYHLSLLSLIFSFNFATFTSRCKKVSLSLCLSVSLSLCLSLQFSAVH